MDRGAERIGEYEILVGVCRAGEIPLEHLGIAMIAERAHGLGVERDRGS
jgi:hypothetical protein